MKDGKFIIATDIETKNHLLKLGYQLIKENKNEYVFLNDKKIVCSEKNGHFSYTNVLAI